MPSLMPTYEPIMLEPEALLAALGRPDAPTLIDVSLDEDVAADPHLIPGAHRRPHRDIEPLADGLRGRCVVVICQKGRKLSQGGAAILRRQGVRAYALAGGNVAWREAGRPRIRIETLPGLGRLPGASWVMAVPAGRADFLAAWLIRRFVDPDATFLFVEAAEVDAVADKFDARALLAESGTPDPVTALRERLGLESDGLAGFIARIEAEPSGREDVFTPPALFEALDRLHGGANERLEAALSLCDLLYAAHRMIGEQGGAA